MVAEAAFVSIALSREEKSLDRGLAKRQATIFLTGKFRSFSIIILQHKK